MTELDLSPIRVGDWSLSFGEIEDGYGGECVVVMLVNAKLNEVREQMVYFVPPFTGTWRETVARRMNRAIAKGPSEYDMYAPLEMIPRKQPNYRIDYFRGRKGSSRAQKRKVERVWSESPADAQSIFLSYTVNPDEITIVKIEKV